MSKVIKLKDLFSNLNNRIKDIEKVLLNNRSTLYDLVEHVNYLTSYIEEDADDELSLSEESTDIIKLQDMVDNYIKKNDSLTEFEEELEKNKDKITPGQKGEA